MERFIRPRALLRKVLKRLCPFDLFGVPALPELQARLEERITAATNSVRDDLLRRLDAARWNTLDRLEAHAPPPPTLVCPICGQNGPLASFALRVATCQFGGGRLVRYTCPACDAIFGPLKILSLSPEDLTFEYQLLYSYYREGDTTEFEMHTFHHLDPRPDGVYLNFGAGAWSHTTSRLRDQGYTVFAFEPFAETAGEFFITDPKQLAEMRFDGIFSHNVIEHLTDPVSSFRWMASHLKDRSSRLAHATPCFEYRYETSRFHLFFFPGRAVQALAARAQLQSVGQDQAPFLNWPYFCHVFAAA